MKYVTLNWHKIILIATSLSILVYTLFFYSAGLEYLFITPDKKGYKLYKQQDYLQASKHFADQNFKGVALFKAGEFKKSEQVLMMLTSKEARYNLGNALFMQGQYFKAVDSYDLALKIDANFTLATQNRALALARQAEIDKHRDNDEGTGGQLAADKIVFDNSSNRGQEITQEGIKEQETQSSANWLDRLQTGPKEFLKNKFAYQYAMEGKENVK